MKDFDPSWVQEIKNNNQRVITKLYNQYYDTVHKSIYSIVKNTEVTEDLSNDVFIKAIAKIESYRENISFNAWIKTMAINQAIDYLRKSINKNTTNSIDNDECATILTDNTNPESDIVRVENLADLRSCIKQLSPRYAQVIELRFYQNLAYEEIGKQMGMPVGTVKSLLHKAKTKLKLLIKLQV